MKLKSILKEATGGDAESQAIDELMVKQLKFQIGKTLEGLSAAKDKAKIYQDNSPDVTRKKIQSLIEDSLKNIQTIEKILKWGNKV